ncbi:MAG: hypothetical protein ACC662_08830 [Planctomycetota bacterium]
MVVLEINWGQTTRVGPVTAVITPGENDEAPDEAPDETLAPRRLDKPLIVYVVAPGDPEVMAKIEDIALDGDKVRIGSNFFRCVKMAPEDAARDSLISKHGEKVPRFVFVGMDYEVVQVLENKISGKKIYDAMKKTAKTCYKGNLDKRVKKFLKVLNEFDKINNARKVLTQKEDRGVKAAEAKKIAKERGELDKRQRKAEEEKRALLDLERKAA